MTDQASAVRPLRLLVVDDHEVVRQGLVSLLFKLTDLRLHFTLVDALYLVMRMHFDPECIAQRRQQVFFIHLGVAVHGFVIDTGRDFAQLRHGLPLEFLKRMCHVQPPS